MILIRQSGHLMMFYLHTVDDTLSLLSLLHCLRIKTANCLISKVSQRKYNKFINFTSSNEDVILNVNILDFLGWTNIDSFIFCLFTNKLDQ